MSCPTSDGQFQVDVVHREPTVYHGLKKAKDSLKTVGRRYPVTKDLFRKSYVSRWLLRKVELVSEKGIDTIGTDFISPTPIRGLPAWARIYQEGCGSNAVLLMGQNRLHPALDECLVRVTIKNRTKKTKRVIERPAAERPMANPPKTLAMLIEDSCFWYEVEIGPLESGRNILDVSFVYPQGHPKLQPVPFQYRFYCLLASRQTSDRGDITMIDITSRGPVDIKRLGE